MRLGSDTEAGNALASLLRQQTRPAFDVHREDEMQKDIQQEVPEGDPPHQVQEVCRIQKGIVFFEWPVGTCWPTQILVPNHRCKQPQGSKRPGLRNPGCRTLSSGWSPAGRDQIDAQEQPRGNILQSTKAAAKSHTMKTKPRKVLRQALGPRLERTLAFCRNYCRRYVGRCFGVH